MHKMTIFPHRHGNENWPSRQKISCPPPTSDQTITIICQRINNGEMNKDDMSEGGSRESGRFSFFRSADVMETNMCIISGLINVCVCQSLHTISCCHSRVMCFWAGLVHIGFDMSRDIVRAIMYLWCVWVFIRTSNECDKLICSFNIFGYIW